MECIICGEEIIDEDDGGESEFGPMCCDCYDELEEQGEIA